MTLVAICLALLFVSPAYYRLKSKGYSPEWFIVPTILFSTAGYVISYYLIVPGLALALLSPAALLLLALALPRRVGAPGAAYLHIEFACPECSQAVTFDRTMEGRAALCPKCGELIDVPGEPAAALQPPAPTAADDGDFIVLRKFLDPMQAELALQRLADEGVEAFLPDRITGGTYPSLQWACGGVRLMVSAADRARAEEALGRPAEETRLPRNFVPPPAPPEPEGDDHLVKILVFAMAFLMVFPFVLVHLWVLIVPLIFPAAIRHGVITGSISLLDAFQISAALSLISVIIAVLAEKRYHASLDEAP
jgi:hypothetical protein